METATPSPLERGARALAKAQSGVDEWDALDEGFQATLKENVAAVLEAAGGEWQMIDSAPKDVEVIVYVPGHKPPVFTASHIDGWRCSVEGRYAPADDYFGDADKEPTHWMSLPAPPQ